MARSGALRLVALGGAAAAAVLALGATAVAAVPAGHIRYEASALAVPGSYLVVLNDATVSAVGVSNGADALARKHGGTVRQTWSSAIRGFELSATPAAARRIAADPAVSYVEQNQVYTIDATQTGATWGIDRIDQHNLPLSGTYTYSTTAANVHAYVIDTGIRFSHSQFGGRATSGWDFVNNDADASDCNGHGTHVAGTIGGSTYGVAKAVQLVGVRVLSCSGSGTTAGVVSGINWVTANAIHPAVANMSLGGGASTTLDNAVNASINSGVTYAIAAGNSNANACNYSPARVSTAITVGATGSNDARASFSNYGSCLDIFAPGVSITSAWYTSNTATNTISGTSMAAPHVAGGAALILANNPNYSPAQVASAMIGVATTGVVTSPGSGSPNRLLFVS